MGHESVCEETVVKKRTLEEKVNEGVEEMPDEDYADLCGRGGVQETYGGEVGGQEKGKGCEKTPYSATIDRKCRLGSHVGCF